MTASLDGVELFDDVVSAWGERAGTGPYFAGYEVDAAAAQELEDGATLHGSTVTIGGVTYRGLSILGSDPGSLPGTRVVVVADRRWALPRRVIRRGYNVPKNGSRLRRLPGLPLGVAPTLPDRVYHAWSLRSGTLSLWTAEEVLADVMDLAFGADGWTGPVPRVDVDVYDLDLLGYADTVLALVFARLGRGIQLGVNPEGLAYLYLSDGDAPSSAGGTRRRRGPGGGVFAGDSEDVPLEGGPLLVRRSRLLERPVYVDTLYQRLVEVRVDHHETTELAETRAEDTAPPPRASWVLQLPEDAVIDGADLVAGTWAQGDGYLAHLSGREPTGLPPLSRRILRGGFLSPAVWVYGSPLLDPSGLWGVRAHVCHSTYRRVYGLRREWVDVLRHPSETRVGVLDPEHGATGPAAVYQDYAEWITWRWVEEQGDGSLPPTGVVRNVYANRGPAEGLGTLAPGGIVGTPLEDLGLAPAELRFLDRDNFVWEVRFRTDWTRQVDRLIPSALQPASIPTDDPEGENPWLAYGNLSDEHEVSVVFTAMLGAPNGTAQLYRDRVYPSDVGAVRGAGPPIEVLETDPFRVARHGWTDTGGALLGQALFSPNPTANAIDQALAEPLNWEDLRANSEAKARSVYHRYEDALVGAIETDLNPGRTLGGRIGSVVHAAGPGGLTTTTTYPLDPPYRAPDSFLPPSVQQTLRRIAAQ